MMINNNETKSIASSSSSSFISIEEYNIKETKRKVCWYKAISIVLVLIIIIQIVFYCIMKANISSIISSYEKQSIAIESKEHQNKNIFDITQNKIINLLANIQGNVIRVTEIFQSVSEFEMVSKWINKNFQLAMCYQLSTDGQMIMNLIELCSVHKGLLFLFQTKTNCRFGAYIDEGFFEFQHIKDANAFLFSLSEMKHYLINDPEKAFEINDRGIEFGKDDLKINDMRSVKSYSRLGQVYDKGSVNYELTCGKSEFELNEIEVYKLFGI